jgi:hypothetical protein
MTRRPNPGPTAFRADPHTLAAEDASVYAEMSNLNSPLPSVQLRKRLLRWVIHHHRGGGPTAEILGTNDPSPAPFRFLMSTAMRPQMRKGRQCSIALYITESL